MIREILFQIFCTLFRRSEIIRSAALDADFEVYLEEKTNESIRS